MDPRQSDSPQVEHAARVLRSGGLVVLPAETVYGVYGDASGAGAGLLALKQLARRAELKPRTYPWTWHAPSLARILEVLPLRSPLHRRVARVWMPGPVRCHVERSDAEIAQTLAALNVAPGILDGEFPETPGRVVSVRVPDHAATQGVLASAGGAMIAESASNFGVGDGQSLDHGAIARAKELGLDALLAAEPTRLGRPSTAIRLLAGGGYRVEGVGAADEREIRARVERRIVFVCSGNTCRSPVAEAIARDLLARRESPPGEAPVPTRVLSAGTGAAPGARMTPESAAVLVEMGIDPGRHASRQLTRDEVMGAERVFVMTRQHRRAVEMLGARVSAELLDPGGADIDDPIGSPLRQYRDMAKSVRRAVELRLAEIEEGDRR